MPIQSGKLAIAWAIADNDTYMTGAHLRGNRVERVLTYPRVLTLPAAPCSAVLEAGLVAVVLVLDVVRGPGRWPRSGSQNRSRELGPPGGGAAGVVIDHGRAFGAMGQWGRADLYTLQGDNNLQITHEYKTQT